VAGWLTLILGRASPIVTIDTLGWGFLASLVLLFGVPYSRYFLRRRAIPTWPVTEAIVIASSAGRGAPFTPKVGLYFLANYSSADYEYVVDGTLQKGSFALMTGNEMIAVTVAQQVLHMKILVRFDPKHPADSMPVPERVLGRKVFTQDSWLNPRVW